MAFLLLNTHSSDENFNGDCDLGIVEITPYIKTTLRKGQRAFRQLSQQLTTLDEIILREPWCLFLSYSDASTYFDDADLPDPGSYRIHFTPMPNLKTVQSVDCPQLFLDKSDVWWNAIPRHSSTHISTTAVSIKDLLACKITRERLK